jgi:hypothetical protein
MQPTANLPSADYTQSDRLMSGVVVINKAPNDTRALSSTNISRLPIADSKTVIRILLTLRILHRTFPLAVGMATQIPIILLRLTDLMASMEDHRILLLLGPRRHIRRT